MHLGSLTPDDVAVELLHGPVAAGDEIMRPRWSAWSGVEAGGEGAGGSGPAGVVRYRGQFGCDRAGRHGYTVRVVPAHPDLAVPVEMGCVAWA